MEREIRVRFTGDARDMQRASEEARRALNTMGRDTAEFSRTASQSMQRVSESTTQTARNMAAELGKMAAAYASVGAAAALFWKGLSHNAELESLKLGMATIVSANETIKDSTGKQVEGAQKLAVAQGQVAEVFERMKLDAINTTATLPQLAQSFNAALAPSMAMGASLDETRKMTVAMVQAMGAMGIPLDQARQEINSILQAQISEDSQLAKNLGLNNEMVKSWKEQGKLVDNLLDRLKDFTVAGAAAGETWNGVTSTLADNMSNLLGVLTGDSFNTLKSRLSDINKSFGPEGQSEAAEWGAIINDSLITAISLGGMVGSVLLKGAEKFKKALQGIRLGGMNLGMAVGRGDAVTNMVRSIPTMAPGGGRQEGITGVGKAALEFLAGSPSSVLLPIAERTMDAKTFERFKKSLEDLDTGLTQVRQEETNRILFKHEDETAKTLAAALKLLGGSRISAKKPAATQGKASGSGLMYGPELPTPADQVKVTLGEQFGPATDDAVEAYKLLAAWRRADEKDLQDLREVGAKKNLDQEKLIGEMRLRYALEAINAAGGFANALASGKGVSGTDFLRGLGGLAGGIVSVANPLAGAGISAGFNVVGSLADSQAEGSASYRRYYNLMNNNTAFSPDALRERKKALEDEIGKRSQQSLWNWDTEGRKQFQDLKLALVDVDKSLSALSKTAAEAAEAQERVSKTANSFGAIMGVSGLRESLGLGKRTTGDIERALMMSGSGVSLGMLGDASKQSGILSALEGLQYAQALGQGDYIADNTPMVTSANASAKQAVTLLESLGISDASGKSVNELVTLLQSVLVPAMQDLKSLTGGAAAGSISGAGSDNALAFDAPQTRMVTNNNAITVNTLAITGDKASVRELARVLAVEMNTMAGQTV